MNKQNNTVFNFLKKQIIKALKTTIKIDEFSDVDISTSKIEVDKIKNIKFGDYCTTIALMTNIKKDRVMSFAQAIAAQINKKYFQKISVVQPGFINFTLSNQIFHNILFEIIDKNINFGISKKNKIKYNIEFISANPTGLLHIGHARNAVIGDVLARIWEANGIDVTREYYINDAGNQIEKLGMSLLIRYKQLFGYNDQLPEDSYHGNEIIEAAHELKNQYDNKFLDTYYDQTGILDKQAGKIIKNFAKNYMLNIIKNTLLDFGVKMHIWFSESTLYENNLINTTLDSLKQYTYKKDGALWLATTKYGDDKDRVLIKSDGNMTYFTPDIAYHNIKMSRGYDKCFNIWGADHTSYADRIKIAMRIFGYKDDMLNILIMQMVKLIKDGAEFKMSKRSGKSLTLMNLVKTIGKDAARWYLVSRPMISHLEIDIDKATKQSNDNPFYYVQYAHARINQILQKKQFDLPKSFDLLTLPSEREIIVHLSMYVETLKKIGDTYEVNILSIYLYNLAKLFHSYYSQNIIIDEKNEQLSKQRYWLVFCIKQIIANGLKLLGIEPLNKM